MTENLYTQYANKYYNPNDEGKNPGDNENWESIQKGFSRIGSTQLETSAGLTLGKGTEDETSLTAAELEELKNSGIEGAVSKVKSNRADYTATSEIQPGGMIGYYFGTLGELGALKPNTDYSLLIRPIACFNSGSNVVAGVFWQSYDKNGNPGEYTFTTDNNGNPPTALANYSPSFNIINIVSIPSGSTVNLFYDVFVAEI